MSTNLNVLAKPTEHRVREIVRKIQAEIEAWHANPNDHEAHDAISEYDIIERVLLEELA